MITIAVGVGENKNILEACDIFKTQKPNVNIELIENDKKLAKSISDKNIDLKQVVNTNKCLIHLEKHGDKLLVISCIDNLLKGASGQAVHNMNLMFNLEETVGLRLKPSAF